MIHRLSVILIAVTAACLPGAMSTGALADVQVEFRVTVPPLTPKDAVIYISGSTKSLGEWNGAGLKLKRDESGAHVGSVELAADQPIEFKITRGSWQTVEKNSEGSERANRTFTPKSDEKVVIQVAAWADQLAAAPASRPSTTAGNIRTHSIRSKLLNNQRKLWIYLPPGYEEHRENRYPVFYLHDGQNLFDASTSFAGEWQADETAERLIKERRIPPLILVGIENTGDRMTEYTPGVRGELYQRFVVEEVKPFIDATYRTSKERAHTAIGGSSLGGLVSLYIAQRNPDVFGACAAISPALWWKERAVMKDLEADPQWMKRTRFWIDMGTDEAMNDPAKNVQDVRDLAELLTKSGLVADRDFRLLVVESAKHNEPAWAQRFGEVLLFFFAQAR